jgi:hypothetical protein
MPPPPELFSGVVVQSRRAWHSAVASDSQARRDSMRGAARQPA